MSLRPIRRVNAARGCGRVSPRLLQQQVRWGKTSALVAKFLVTVARVSREDCERKATAFASITAIRARTAMRHLVSRCGSEAGGYILNRRDATSGKSGRC